MPKIKIKGQTVQTGECPQTNGRTHTHTHTHTDATKRIISPATWSIKSLTNPAFICRSLTGRCHGNQLNSQIGVFLGPIFIVVLAISKRIGILKCRWASYKHIESCITLLRFDSIAPEKLVLIFYLCEKIAKMDIFNRLSRNVIDRS